FELRDFPLENLSRPPQARRYRPLRDLQQRSNLRHRHFLEGMQHEHRLGRILHDLEDRSEEHTSELQSRENLVCRLLLEKKSPPEGLPDPPAAHPDLAGGVVDDAPAVLVPADAQLCFGATWSRVLGRFAPAHLPPHSAEG